MAASSTHTVTELSHYHAVMVDSSFHSIGLGDLNGVRYGYQQTLKMNVFVVVRLRCLKQLPLRA